MTPYSIFKLCEGIQGRKYRGTEEDFEELPLCGYYRTLSKYMYDQVGKYSKSHIKFIKICESEYGSRFNSFDLMSASYYEVYEGWMSIHKNAETYKRNVLQSIQFIYEFCIDKDIRYMNSYIRTWAVTHIISGKLNENVAVLLEVHEQQFTKPEKKLLRRKFLSKVKDIKERLSDDDDLKTFIEEQLELVKENILDN